MEKQKQIEEMAKIICGRSKDETCLLDKRPCDCGCGWARTVEKIYNAGYRKEESVRKETTEKFARKAKELFFGVNCVDIYEWNWYHDKLDEICKELEDE